jgi:hypothetical protein
MEDGGVELLGVLEVHHGRCKEGVIRAILGPPILPCVPVRVVSCMPGGFELMPLETCMEAIQTVVEDFGEGECWLWSFRGAVSIGCEITVAVLTRDFCRHPTVDERTLGSRGLCAPSLVLAECSLFGS